MLRSRFLSMLPSLPAESFKAFQRYARQTHHQDAVALQVLDYIKKYYPDLEAMPATDLQGLSRKIFKKGAVTPKKLSDAFSDLYLCLKDFLLAEKLKTDENARQILWMQVLLEHRWKDDFAREAERFFREDRQRKVGRVTDYLPSWFAHYFQREHLSWNRRQPDFAAMEECTAVMAECWEVLRLKMACEVRLLQKSRTKGLVTAPQQQRSYRQQPAMVLKTVYEELWLLATTDDEQHYERLEGMLRTYGRRLAPEELMEIMMYLKNHVAPQARNNQEIPAGQKLHRLNVLGWELGLFAHQGLLSAAEFSNMVNTACAVGELDWAMRLVRNYGKHLPPALRADTERLCLAIIDFARADFRQVLQRLEGHSFPALQDELRAKCLILRAYYELPAYEHQVYEYCIAFGDQLRKKKQSDPIRAIYNFVQIVKLLAAKRASRERLYQRIDQGKQLYFRSWLREKADQYDRKHAARRFRHA